MTAARVRLAAGLVVLAVVLARLGTGPFVRGLRDVDATALLLALLLAVPTTVACAWRWCVLAHRHRLPLGLVDATAACFRAQLVNTTLPGGVLGDVERAVRHGRAVADTPVSARVVVLDRVSGQLVQLALAAVVLLASPGLVPEGLVPVVVAVAAVLVPLAAMVLLRCPAVVLASLVALAGHVAAVLVAARTAGVTAPLSQMLPLALVVLAGAAVPLNVAGWGPREGVAAWAFATAGLGAAAGTETAVVLGVMTLVAALPGLVVLVTDRRRRSVPVRVPIEEAARA